MALEIKIVTMFILLFAGQMSCSYEMCSRRAIPMGTPKDFKLTESVLNQHKQLKKDVITILQDLSEKAEGLVIEKIEDEMVNTVGKMAGRVTIIGFGGATMCLLVTPIVGIGGVVFGYMVVGGSTWYEMKIPEKQAETMKEIQAKLEAQISRYTQSQEKAIRELDMYDVFESGNNFEENLEAVKALVRLTEKNAKIKLPNIKSVLNKLEDTFNYLDDHKKMVLKSKDFLMTVDSLIQQNGYSIPEKTNKKLPIAIAAIAAEESSSYRRRYWGQAIHGINIITNIYFLYMDIKDFIELNKQRNAWNEKGEAKQELLKNTKFEHEIEMRVLILQIRDKILENGF